MLCVLILFYFYIGLVCPNWDFGTSGRRPRQRADRAVGPQKGGLVAVTIGLESVQGDLNPRNFWDRKRIVQGRIQACDPGVRGSHLTELPTVLAALQLDWVQAIEIESFGDRISGCTERSGRINTV